MDGKMGVSRKRKESFLMAAEDVFLSGHNEIIISGTVERGSVHAGDELEVIGTQAEKRRMTVKELRIFRAVIDSAAEGESIDVVFNGNDTEEIKRGCVLAEPGTFGAHAAFEAVIEIAEEDPENLFASGEFAADFCFRTAEQKGILAFTDQDRKKEERNQFRVHVELLSAVPMECGDCFAMRSDNHTIAFGIVKNIPDHSDKKTAA